MQWLYPKKRKEEEKRNNMRKRLSENENGNGDRGNAERTNSSFFLHFSGFESGNRSLADTGGYSGMSMFSAPPATRHERKTMRETETRRRGISHERTAYPFPRPMNESLPLCFCLSVQVGGRAREPQRCARERMPWRPKEFLKAPRVCPRGSP